MYILSRYLFYLGIPYRPGQDCIHAIFVPRFSLEHVLETWFQSLLVTFLSFQMTLNCVAWQCLFLGLTGLNNSCRSRQLRLIGLFVLLLSSR